MTVTNDGHNVDVADAAEDTWTKSGVAVQGCADETATR